MEHRNRAVALPHASEELEQTYLMNWVCAVSNIYPDIDMLYHIPNGGKRNKAEAARLKAAGVKAGVCDLHLPVARGGYHSLYIEMKVGDNKPTEAQEEFITRVRALGNAAEVCYGWQEARKALMAYYSLKEENKA